MRLDEAGYRGYTYVAIVPVGIGGVSSGLPLGPYCPIKEPSSVKRPRMKQLC